MISTPTLPAQQEFSTYRFVKIKVVYASAISQRHIQHSQLVHFNALLIIARRAVGLHLQVQLEHSPRG
jgi:hypothetical protein